MDYQAYKKEFLESLRNDSAINGTDTEDEFLNIVSVNAVTSRIDSDTISQKFNTDAFNPRDGEIVKAADDLAALVEAYISIGNGIKSKDLFDSQKSIKERYRNRNIGGIDFGLIMEWF